MSIKAVSIVLLSAALAASFVRALDNGLALRPPMGWLAWERFVCETDCARYPNECINQQLFEQMGERMVVDGYRAVGYEYVNIDDCWSKRDRNQSSRQLEPDASRFPSMRSLADKLHGQGLKLGIYGDCGTYTCQRFPGQLNQSGSLEENYFMLDARSFADWTIDSFKFDGCYLDVKRGGEICPLMGVALNLTRRPMLFSCSWPAYENDEHLPTDWEKVVESCNLWRAFGDIEDSWSSVLETVDYFVKQQDLVARYHGPGHWFDADQLVVGNFGLSLDQERAQMAIWSIWASPLYMSNDLRNIRAESSQVLRNKWVIAVNQDPLGQFGLMVEQTGQVQAFVKLLEPPSATQSCPSYALVYFDRRTLGNGRLVSFKLASLISKAHAKLEQVDPGRWSRWSHCGRAHSRSTMVSVHDLFADSAQVGKPLNLSTDSLELRVNPSGVRMVKLIEHEPTERDYYSVDAFGSHI